MYINNTNAPLYVVGDFVRVISTTLSSRLYPIDLKIPCVSLRIKERWLNYAMQNTWRNHIYRLEDNFWYVENELVLDKGIKATRNRLNGAVNAPI